MRTTYIEVTENTEADALMAHEKVSLAPETLRCCSESGHRGTQGCQLADVPSLPKFTAEP